MICLFANVPSPFAHSVSLTPATHYSSAPSISTEVDQWQEQSIVEFTLNSITYICCMMLISTFVFCLRSLTLCTFRFVDACHPMTPCIFTSVVEPPSFTRRQMQWHHSWIRHAMRCFDEQMRPRTFRFVDACHPMSPRISTSVIEPPHFTRQQTQWCHGWMWVDAMVKWMWKQ